MKLSKGQIISIALFSLLFIIIYFGFDTNSKEQNALVKTREQNLEILDLDRVIREERKNLSGDVVHVLTDLDEQLANTSDKSETVELLKAKASIWYQNSNPLISGYYAKKIAETLETDEQAWAICGTTFAIAAKASDKGPEQEYALKNSRLAYESAISINPNEVDHKINQALSYVDFPEDGNPMKGILQLIDLNKTNPDNTAVLFQLGRLALGTNQLEKAVERLTRVTELDPDNKQAHCLLAECFEKLGETQKADNENKICNS